MSEREPTPAEFEAAFEAAFAAMRARIAADCDTRREWPQRVAAGIRAVIAFGVESPREARLLTLEALGQGEHGRDLYERMVSHFAEQLRSAREDGDEPEPGAVDPLATLESAAVGGVALLFIRRASNGSPADLPAMAPDAIQFVLAPYLGIEEAERVAGEVP